MPGTNSGGGDPGRNMDFLGPRTPESGGAKGIFWFLGPNLKEMPAHPGPGSGLLFSDRLLFFRPITLFQTGLKKGVSYPYEIHGEATP